MNVWMDKLYGVVKKARKFYWVYFVLCVYWSTRYIVFYSLGLDYFWI